MLNLEIVVGSNCVCLKFHCDFGAEILSVETLDPGLDIKKALNGEKHTVYY